MIDIKSSTITASQVSQPIKENERQLLLDEIKRLKKQLHDAELEAWEAQKALEDYKSWAELEMHRRTLTSNDPSSETMPIESNPSFKETAGTQLPESLQKNNSLYTDILGWSHLYQEKRHSFNLNYETALFNYLSLTLSILSSGYHVKESDFEYTVSEFGFGGGIKYYPFYQSISQGGFWVGSNAKIIFWNDEYKDTLGAIGESGSQYLLGTEVGYKWVLGNRHWFFISPFIGYYYSTLQFETQLDDNNSDFFQFFFYTGLNIGIVF
ncbi:DUF3575 domain-containing protein [bacterium]|nr:DUF3575 domain-containing protein [bacterium]